MRRAFFGMWCLTLAGSLAASGCAIDWGSEDEDEEWWDDDGGSSVVVTVGGGSFGSDAGDGSLGAHCHDDGECGEGLVCDLTTFACDAPAACSDHADCGGFGAFCDHDGLCAKGDLCVDDAQCPTDWTCDTAIATCLPPPPAPPACDTLSTEAECDARSDCEAIYAGVDCSCGPGCTCMGGEEGCVCANFEFFKCADPGA